MASLTQLAQPRPQVEEKYLLGLAKSGSADAYDQLVRRYHGFVRRKASAYFLTGGEADDLIQEGMLGLYKAIRDYRSDREASFRSFAELCIQRQIISAVKTSTRHKQKPLNQSVSFAGASAADADVEATLEDVLSGPGADDPSQRAIATEELHALVDCLARVLSELESCVLAHYLDGRSYEWIAQRLDSDAKRVDNALQRVKHKVRAHLATRAVLA